MLLCVRDSRKCSGVIVERWHSVTETNCPIYTRHLWTFFTEDECATRKKIIHVYLSWKELKKHLLDRDTDSGQGIKYFKISTRDMGCVTLTDTISQRRNDVRLGSRCIY